MKSFAYAILHDPNGLHIRPAGVLVRKVKEYPGHTVTITKDGKTASALKAMDLTKLRIKQNDTFTVSVEGENEEKVASELETFFREKLDAGQSGAEKKSQVVTLQGTGVSSGVASGKLYFYQRVRQSVDQRTVEDTEAELARFRDAKSKAIDALGDLAEKARTEAGDTAAQLFEAHQMLVEDPDYLEAIEELIRKEKRNAESAVQDAGERFAGEYAAMDDEYLRARAADVRDISARILSCLTGAVQSGIESPEPVILAADDLAPSETVQLDKEKILGFVTAGGSGSGHTAILARTMGIPAVIGVGDSLKPEYGGKEVIIDGGTGKVIVSPDEKEKLKLLQKQKAQRKKEEQLNLLKGKASVTKDGRAVRIYCNIGDPGDVPMVKENDGAGIGLFRSEFLYLNSEDFPTEEAQFKAYKQVLTDMGDREVIIRTMDIGADKQIDYFKLPREENPALGNRALRICLNRPEIFRTQLRALYRASAFGRLGIMFPMVTSVWEVEEAKKQCNQVKSELASEGIAFSDQVEVGVMIETPAAALMSDRLAGIVDFFSCGTNDLTQYTLACDRQNSDLGRFFDPHHPAVLRLLKLVAENAHKNGIWVGICGELASDLSLTETFLAMGIDELSVSPRAVLPLRQKVLETDVSACRDRILNALTDSLPSS